MDYIINLVIKVFLFSKDPKAFNKDINKLIKKNKLKKALIS